MSTADQQVNEVAHTLTNGVAPVTDDQKIAHAQAMLTLALVREQRTANMIAWVSQPGWQPSRKMEERIMGLLGLGEEAGK